MVFPYEQIITFSLGLIGTVLGLLNTYRSIIKDTLKIKVIPKCVTPVGRFDPRINIAIEVINLSTFPFTLSEVGFTLKNTNKRACIIIPITIDGTKLPCRLEPRAAITIYGILDDITAINIKKAYALTACGCTHEGTSLAIKSHVKNIKNSQTKI